MNAPYFNQKQPIKFKKGKSKGLAFRHYDADRKVLGKRMEDQLRFAACYWHSFCWPGTDPFGGETFLRPWQTAETMENAHLKADAAFEMFELLDVPFFTFHDRDIAPEGETLAESNKNVREIGEVFARKMEKAKVRLLWGTANLFSNRRYMGGGATNPDPDVFAYAAAQVKNVLELTHDLKGENYVLWGGREGYETLLNTDIKRELDQLGRFLTMVVEHKHKIGFKGTILIEPKPKEPTKHQYDFDVASIYGMLQAFDLQDQVKINIEQNHAILAGHTFEHELALASAVGILGSIDINRGDYQLGWDTDQFAMNIPEMALACYYIFKEGGLGTGGFNFDAKLRRQSIDPDDLLEAHVGSMDACARGLLIAEKMINDGVLADFVAERYAGWDTREGKAILAGKRSLDDLSKSVLKKGLDPQPKSGKQEHLERLLNDYI
ncbi:xylose isomerase [Bauldia litoralis]|uniref:Xylose isomerase n=1 Tax=Bauldia litoralis TaxID=665467 RepID=A0A1G6CFX5_9HYPH|nr:xylose isomerase [Bauldia litoralis]SDB31807.1 xylose isomerase [Bauldia litoralis]